MIQNIALINVRSMLFVIMLNYFIYPMYVKLFLSIPCWGLSQVILCQYLNLFSETLTCCIVHIQGDLRGFCKHIFSVHGPLSGYVTALLMDISTKHVLKCFLPNKYNAHAYILCVHTQLVMCCITLCNYVCTLLTQLLCVIYAHVLYPLHAHMIYSIYFFCVVHVYNRVFFGSRPVYVIADVDLFKEITVKHFDKFVDRLVRPYTPLLHPPPHPL